MCDKIKVFLLSCTEQFIDNWEKTTVICKICLFGKVYTFASIFKQTGTERKLYINAWLLIMLRSIFKQHKEENHISMGWLWIMKNLENC